MRAKHTALVLTAGFLLVPTLTWSQFPGAGTPGSGGPGGMRAMLNDPDQLFNIVSKGQDVIRVDQLDPFSKSMFDRFASRYGLSGNEISRDQFKTAFTRIREEAARGQLNFQGGPGGGMDRDRRLDDRFQSMDRDQDGVLSHEELSDTLQGEREKYDTNHDGKIDLNEYRAYVEARRGDSPRGGDNNARREGGRPGEPDEPAEDERKRPTILRAGNLPRDFPYGILDQQGDNDGQVGLYEWKGAGRRIGEFVTMDLNNDGFLTVEEYYRWRKQSQGDSGRNTSLAGNFNGRGMGMMGFDPRMAMNMRGQGDERRGPGGDRGYGMMGGSTPGGMMGNPMTFSGASFSMPGSDRGSYGRGPGGDRGSFSMTMPMPMGMMGGDRGSMRGMDGGPRGPRGQDGERGRGPGGDRGSYSGLTTPGAYPQAGMTRPGQYPMPGAGMTSPMMGGPGRWGGDRGNMGDQQRPGPRGPRMGPPGGDRGGDQGDRRDRPRKDRDR
jgi:Ca2+-binding EF-hand superfamily protein